MGIQTIVHGYIEFSQGEEDSFIDLLGCIRSDDILSLFGRELTPNINKGYRSSIVPFALSVKSNEWRGVDALFERFISEVNSFISATIIFEIEETSEDIKIDYVFDGELIHRLGTRNTFVVK